LAAAALAHDIHVSVSPGGTRDGRFLPNGIRWGVERLFAWMSRYRRLNIVYDRAPELFAAHIWIAMISIISRRLVAQTQPQQGIYSRTVGVDGPAASSARLGLSQTKTGAIHVRD
jgi:hypothetical protein